MKVNVVLESSDEDGLYVIRPLVARLCVRRRYPRRGAPKRPRGNRTLSRARISVMKYEISVFFDAEVLRLAK